MRLSKQKMGWIGVDVGISTVKIAQLARTKHGCRLAASAIVPRHSPLQLAEALPKEAVSARDELQAARSLQDGYRGRSVAAALPMSLCDLHRLDRDLNREPNAQNVLRQTIETATQQSVEGLQCDYWSAPATESQPAWSQALTIPISWTDQVCEDIAQVGWSCEAIDGQPMAIARALSMVHQGDPSKPIAGLDWGSGRATLCFLENRQPSYVRTLKLCGLGDLLDNLSKNLEITDVEAQRLLEEHGIAGAANARSTEVSALLTELLSEYLANLVQELERSVAHFQYVRRLPKPKHLYLLGGGAMINGLDAELTSRLNMKTRNWQLPSRNDQEQSVESRAECLLATAIALSALAWEAP